MSNAFGALLVALFAPVVLELDGADLKAKLTREYDLKAAFLFNFAQFVEWPPEAFPDATTPVVIGVLGEDPFGKSLEVIVADQTVRGREVIVRRSRNVQEVLGCHILYISASETPRLPRIMSELNGKSILTVGESEEFTERNGIIRFLIDGGKLQLRINVEAAKGAKLTISSQLLRQAQVITANRER